MNEIILEDLQTRFGIQVQAVQPIEGCCRNEKWKIQSNQSLLIVKHFSISRYPIAKLNSVQNALIWQNNVYTQGVPCPQITMHNGLPIQQVNDELFYMVMTFCPGVHVTPDNTNTAQMYSLGQACGQLHHAFKAIALDNIHFAPEPTLESIREKCRQSINALSSDGSPEYSEVLHKQAAIISSLTETFWESQPKGLAHRDFAIDNILFEGDKVSAVLDFDTSAYSYPHRDIGRALLSFAFDGQILHPERVQAFAKGYAAMQELTSEEMANAMRLIWCLEATTWLHRDFFWETRKKVACFREEMIWMTEHWHELEDLMH